MMGRATGCKSTYWPTVALAVLTALALGFWLRGLRQAGGEEDDGGQEGAANHEAHHRANRLPQG